MTFNCGLEDFKRGVAEFLKEVPSCDEDSLENGWKALGLMYLGLRQEHKADIHIAASYLKYASRRYFDRSMEFST